MQPEAQTTSQSTSGTRTPEQVRADVERTQGDLQRNVNELNERMNPSRVMARQKETVQSSLSGVRGRIMGMPNAVAQNTSDMQTSVRTKTQGNPLAAGAVALGVGWIIGGLLPVSEAEKTKMTELEEQAKEQVQPVIEKTKEQTAPLIEKANEAVAPS